MKKITLTATDEDYDAAMPGFLKQNPIPLDDDDQPIYTPGAWIKVWLENKFYKEAKYGTKKIAGEAVTLNKPFK